MNKELYIRKQPYQKIRRSSRLWSKPNFVMVLFFLYLNFLTYFFSNHVGNPLCLILSITSWQLNKKSSLFIQILANLQNCEQMMPYDILFGIFEANAGSPKMSNSNSLLLSYTLVKNLLLLSLISISRKVPILWLSTLVFVISKNLGYMAFIYIYIYIFGP